jgi:hypothetical protein
LTERATGSDRRQQHQRLGPAGKVTGTVTCVVTRVKLADIAAGKL